MDNKKHIDNFAASVEFGFYHLEGESLPAIRRRISSFNILEVTAATNGYCGGDSGHGSRTVISFRDLGSTDIRIRKIPGGFSDGGVEIILGGDSELTSIQEACKFVVRALDRLIAKSEGDKKEADPDDVDV